MSRPAHPAHPGPRPQRGASLVITVLMLLMVVIITLMTARIGLNQLRLGGNLQYQNGALNSAETAVATAESWLAAANNYTDSGFSARSAATPQLYPIGTTIDPLSMTWDDTTSVAVGSSARYAIELIARDKTLAGESEAMGTRSTTCAKVNLYRVSATGSAERGAERVVQSIYAKQVC